MAAMQAAISFRISKVVVKKCTLTLLYYIVYHHYCQGLIQRADLCAIIAHFIFSVSER